jgi:3-hydroxyisobutyrate dehydrogenase-like beta-hydroxyacid dehydrogenase
MSDVRIGIIGTGGMGSFHANYLTSGSISRARLTAVCDINPAAMEKFEGVARYTNHKELIKSGDVDMSILWDGNQSKINQLFEELGSGQNWKQQVIVANKED